MGTRIGLSLCGSAALCCCDSFRSGTHHRNEVVPDSAITEFDTLLSLKPVSVGYVFNGPERGAGLR